MLWTLYRHIFADLMVVFTLTLIGLTSILALAGVLIRTRQEGLDSGQIALIFIYLLPVMLTVTLPFAALFSATLVFGRMSGNNEINACRAGGISLARLLAPPAALAVLTGGATFWLTNWVIPNYTMRVERAARENFKSGLLTRLRSRGRAPLPGAGGAQTRIFADGADPRSEPATIDNAALLIRNGETRGTIVTARRMTMEFDSDGGRLRMAMYDAWVVPHNLVSEDAAGKPASGKAADAKSAAPPDRRIEADKLTVSVALPSRFNFRSRFGSLDELLALRREPVTDHNVRAALAGLQAAWQALRCRELLAEQFPDGARAGFTFVRPSAAGDGVDDGPVPAIHYRLTGVRTGPVGSGALLSLRDVALESYPAPHAQDPTAAPSYRELRAASATVEADVNPGAGRNLLRIRLKDCTSARVRRGEGLEEISQVRRPDWSFDGIAPVPAPADAGAADHARIMRESADWPDAPELRGARADLDAAVARLVRTIDSHLHSRSASAACCLLFVFLGAGLGVMCRTGDYVLAMAISAVPGAVTIGVIAVGGRIYVDMARPTLGMLVIWGGPLLLLAAGALLWRKLLSR